MGYFFSAHLSDYYPLMAGFDSVTPGSVAQCHFFKVRSTPTPAKFNVTQLHYKPDVKLPVGNFNGLEPAGRAACAKKPESGSGLAHSRERWACSRGRVEGSSVMNETEKGRHLRWQTSLQLPRWPRLAGL